MRRSDTTDQLRLQVIAGSHVVLLGIHLPEALCTNLLGFAIHRTDHDEQEANWLRGKKTFLATDPGFLPGATYSTREHPIQGFTWSDFAAKPNRRYTYRVVALTGTPAALVPDREVSVEVTTETGTGDVHDVFFNRGAAASQEYAEPLRHAAQREQPGRPALGLAVARGDGGGGGVPGPRHRRHLGRPRRRLRVPPPAIRRAPQGGQRPRRARASALRRLRQSARRTRRGLPPRSEPRHRGRRRHHRRCASIGSPAPTCRIRRSPITSSSCSRTTARPRRCSPAPPTSRSAASSARPTSSTS